MAYTEPDLKRPELGRTDVTSTTEADHDENGREEQRGTVDTKSVVKHKTHKKKRRVRSEQDWGEQARVNLSVGAVMAG